MRSWWHYEVESWWARLLVGRRPARTLARLGVILLLYFGVFRVLFMPIRVWGHSMAPTFREGRPCLIYRWAYRDAPPVRGDVVLLRKSGTLARILKRVIGLPGERVMIVRGRVLVNGVLLAESYAQGRRIRTPEVTLQPDEYFAVGDNRDISEAGVVKREEILGKVIW
jgi:signal peptidase I